MTQKSNFIRVENMDKRKQIIICRCKSKGVNHFVCFAITMKNESAIRSGLVITVVVFDLPAVRNNSR